MTRSGQLASIRWVRFALPALLFGALVSSTASPWPAHTGASSVNPQGGIDYYVSPSGDDSNSGISPTSAWKTNLRINTTSFRPGDRILFEGGHIITYANDQAIVLGSDDIGSATNPIVISSYGAGIATLSAALGGGGIAVFNVGGVEIRNLKVIGSGRTANTEEGIKFMNNPPTPFRLDHIYLDNVEVSGFGTEGVLIWGEYGIGFQDVRLTNLRVYDNGKSGIEVGGAFDRANYSYVHQNVYVAHNTAHDNSGIRGQNSGSGIVVWQVDGALIERNVAYNNGWLGGNSSGGPVGIWAFECTNVTIQYNESHHNRTGGPWDGGGFDLDAGTTRSVMQYNYSHDNDGPGYLLAEPQVGTPYHHNVLRYNISQNDSRTNSGAISLWHDNNGISDIEIYHNTIFVSPNTTGDVAAVKFKSPSTNVHIRNNIFIGTGGVSLLIIAAGQSGIQFQGNDYWTAGGNFRIDWQGATYTGLTSWIGSTGQERLGGSTVGKNLDPQVTLAGMGGTVGNADLLASLQAYRLQSTSPLLNAGLNLPALFGIDTGPHDFFGNNMPSASVYDVGANEYVGGAVATPLPTSAPTVTTTPAPIGSFPSTDILDTFDRPDGPLGPNWGGYVGQYAIATNQVIAVGACCEVSWITDFADTQEAYLTLGVIDPSASEIGLVLKVQGATTLSGGLKISFMPSNQLIQVWTREPGGTWISRGASIAANFEAGSLFGARARANGLVEIFKNNAQLGAVDVTSWSLSPRSGRIGFLVNFGGTTQLDNFGGGKSTSKKVYLPILANSMSDYSSELGLRNDP